MSETTDWETRGHNERRLGLLIMETRGEAEMPNAAAHLRNAIDAFAKAGWSDRQAECLLQLGHLQRKRELAEEAAEAFTTALRLSRRLNDQQGACDAAAAAAEALADAAEWQQAERHSQQALELAKDINNHLGIAACQRTHGRVLCGAHKYDEALAALEAARDTYVQYRKHVDTVSCRERIGEACLHSNRIDQARSEYRQAVDQLTEMGRPFDVSELLSRWADVELAGGHHDQALTVLAEAETIHRQANHQQQLCDILRRRGMSLLKIQQAKNAIPVLEEALDLADLAEDSASAARCSYMLASAHAEEHDQTQALTLLDKAQAYLDQAEAVTPDESQAASVDLHTRERILAARARILRQSGDQAAARDATEAWLAVIQEAGNRENELRALGSLATLCQETGTLDEAETHLRRLWSLADDGPYPRERAFADRGLAALLIKREAFEEALPHLARAIDQYSPALHDPNGTKQQLVVLERLLHQRAACHVRLKKVKEALADLTGCLKLLDGPLQEQATNPNHLAAVLAGMASAHRRLGDHAQATQCQQRADAICDDQGKARGTTLLKHNRPE